MRAADHGTPGAGRRTGCGRAARGKAAGYVLFTPRSTEQWGPNAWAEDAGSAGDSEAIREAYAAVAAQLVDGGIRGHWAMTPTSDAESNDAWFSLSFGLQHAYAWQRPVGADFEPRTHDQA